MLFTAGTLALSILAAYGTTQAPTGPPAIELRTLADGSRIIEVTGLSSGEVEDLRKSRGQAGVWSGVLAVYVQSGEAGPPADQPPVLGSLDLVEGALRFTPRFPFLPGVSYLALYDPRPLRSAHERGQPGRTPLRRVLRIPGPPLQPATNVEQVYPSSETLPANLLRFYLHFSAPMRRGESYRHIRLMDGHGRRIELPFLELDQELWDPAGRRLTLLLDPGRIKQGLRPREEVGPALEEGRNYTLVIDREWKDAAGNLLRSSFQKRFSVGPADGNQPDPHRWKILAPRSSSRGPLVIQFPEPLDHGMLQRVIEVRDAAGTRLEGEIDIDRGESRWRFTPGSPWRTGSYRVVVDSTLEDLAGNSIERPFELDVFRRVERRVTPKTVSLEFEVRPR